MGELGVLLMYYSQFADSTGPKMAGPGITSLTPPPPPRLDGPDPFHYTLTCPLSVLSPGHPNPNLPRVDQTARITASPLAANEDRRRNNASEKLKFTFLLLE